MRDEMEKLAVKSVDKAELCFAQTGGALRDHIKHWLPIGGRAADNAKHIAGRRLVLQRLCGLPCPLLHLLEKADVLDRNYGLVGKGLDEFDLAVGEGPGFRSRHCED